MMIQPPRGFGENPVAIYHDPELPPSHHYLAAYRWLDEDFGADAIVHLGKHGTLEWLPGKGLGLSAECAPDAVLGDIPLVYPFIVNDPGEGTQAKRRAHAVIVDHLVPPMARADTYGDMAKLEQLLDEYATVAALDPDKLPALRAQIWSLVQAAQLHQDLGVAGEPEAAEFDEFVLHIDGYLCEVKDAAIRDGLHILGAAPAGEALINLVWSSCALGAALGRPLRRAARPAGRPRPRRHRRVPRRHRRVEETARALVVAMDEAGWDPARAADVCAAVRRRSCRGCRHHRRDRRRAARARRRLRARRPVRLADPRPGQRAADRAQLLLGRPEGHPVPQLVGDRPGAGRFAAGQAPGRRGRVPALRRPDRVGHLGDAHPGRRHRRGARADRLPAGVGRRVPPGHRVRDRAAAELGRPRIDVTLRISGFFRDAFPHVIALLDDAIAAVAGLDEPAEDQLPAGARPPTTPGTATGAGPRPASSAPSRARTAPGCCR
jgi:cobaltochelatase CobN